MPRTKLDARPISTPMDWRLDLGGVTWTFTELVEVVHRDKTFVRDHVLKPNRLELDMLRGGPVKYSKTKRDPWAIQARPMSYWIERNWAQIQGEGWN